MATTKELITSAPEDLLVEILIRLPDHRSLFRCKSVCKIWNSLISAPYFRRRFVSRYQTLSAADELESPFMTYSELSESISSFLPFPRETQCEFYILDTCKDLVLVGFDGWGNCEELRRTHLVCNPSTKQWVALPLLPKLPPSSCSFANLICEPFDSDDQAFPCRFRVVKMHDPATSQSQVDAYVFYSGSGQWTKFVLPNHDDLRYSYKFCSGVVSSNEKLYWMNLRSEVVKWDPSCATFPTLIDNSKLDYCCHGPFVFQGALHSICYKIKGSPIGCSVWRLEEEEEGGGWSKRYEISSFECEGMIIHDCQVEAREWISLICVHPQKSEIMFVRKYLSCCRRSALFCWNFRKKEVKFIGLVPFTKGLVMQPRVTVWPSLIPDHSKLQKSYDGSYSCWRRASNQSA